MHSQGEEKNLSSLFITTYQFTLEYFLKGRNGCTVELMTLLSSELRWLNSLKIVKKGVFGNLIFLLSMVIVLSRKERVLSFSSTFGLW